MFVFGWPTWDTGLFLIFYFVPTTFVLLVLSFLNLINLRHNPDPSQGA